MNEFSLGYAFNPLIFPTDLSECFWHTLLESGKRTSFNEYYRKIVWLWENKIAFSVKFSVDDEQIYPEYFYILKVIIPNNNDAMFFKLKWS